MDQPPITPDVSKINLALSRLEKVILDSIDFKEVIQKICDSIFYELDYLRLGYRIVVLALKNEEKQTLDRVAISRTSKAETGIASLPFLYKYLNIPLSAKDNYCIKSMEEKKLLITHYWPDILTPPLNEQEAIETQKKSEIKTSMVYPLLVKDKAIGIMIFSMIKNETEVLPEEDELLLRFTDIAALAVQNSQLYSSLEETTKNLQQANEKLKIMDKLKDEFVSLASHELRTPMTAIRSYLWMLLDEKTSANLGTLTEKQKLYLDRTYKSTERLINLVNDMLSVSRIESGRLVITPKNTNIVDLAKSAVNDVLPTAQEHKLMLSVKNPEKPLPNVTADEEKIKQVLINLIGNSLKFTPENGSITVSFLEKDKQIAISVTDTGSGIKPEDMDKLFTKFGMIEGNYGVRPQSKGTGLGLYISKSIVELHGGHFTVFSEGEGKGTTFTFTLPISNG